jgi:hypothetical protein
MPAAFSFLSHHPEKKPPGVTRGPDAPEEQRRGVAFEYGLKGS